MNNLIRVGNIIFKKENFLSLSCNKIGSKWCGGYDIPIYEYKLYLKEQAPIILDRDNYYELKRKLGEH